MKQVADWSQRPNDLMVDQWRERDQEEVADSMRRLIDISSEDDTVRK